MNAAKSIESCSRFDYALSAYVDGELDPGHALDLEVHLSQCTPCCEQVMFLRALRASMKRTVSSRCPVALRAKLREAIAHERTQGVVRAVDQEAEPPPRLFHKGHVAAIAVAASVAVAAGALQQMPARSGAEKQERLEMASAASVESLLDDLVTQHAQPLPPETTDPNDLPRFDPFVGVPVRRPTFQSMPVNFMGARVHTMRDRRAAMLQYVAHGGHRVTVYLFNSRALPVQKAPHLQPRLVLERPVYVGRINGYSVAAAERSGVGYALASDLGDDESTQLMLAAMQ